MNTIQKTLVLLVVFSVETSCSGFAEVDRDGATSNSGDADSSGGTGPGKWGALPSGYCCTRDDECRNRKCLDQGAGGKTCADECETDGICQGQIPDLHCDTNTYNPGRCVPRTPGKACVPASDFGRGGKPLGGCCVATHNNLAGKECAGNLCYLFYSSSDFMCTNACKSSVDCPGDYICMFAGNQKVCIPLNKEYTCK